MPRCLKGLHVIDLCHTYWVMLGFTLTSHLVRSLGSRVCLSHAALQVADASDIESNRESESLGQLEG